MRVFLDTNVLVSAVATRGLCSDVLLSCLAEHELLLGETVLLKLRRVLLQKLRLPEPVAEEYDSFLRRQATVIEGAPPLSVELRDSRDLIVLAEAIAGGADILVTGDRDLLEMPGVPPLPVLSPRDFWERLRSPPLSFLS